jgi:hypothetical protein
VRGKLIATQEQLITANIKDTCDGPPLTWPSDYIVPVIPPVTEINCAVIYRLFSDTSDWVASARSSTNPRQLAALVCSNSES